MSYGDRLGNGETRIEVGGTYSNDLSERFEEQRQVTRIEGKLLHFEVTKGKRMGAMGSCQVGSFWLWLRKRV